MEMGCGASKDDVIKSASSGADGPTDKPNKNPSNGKKGEDHKNSKDSLNSSLASEGSTIPASEMYQNGGNGNNNGGPLKPLKTLPPLKPIRSTKMGSQESQGEHVERPEPIAFEVPADEDGSLIKRHPPRRLRQLEDKPPELPNLTHEEIEEKVAMANQRRNQVLTQRVASARQKSGRGARVRKPAPDSEQYNMAEYEHEIDGGIGSESTFGGNEF